MTDLEMIVEIAEKVSDIEECIRKILRITDDLSTAINADRKVINALDKVIKNHKSNISAIRDDLVRWQVRTEGD